MSKDERTIFDLSKEEYDDYVNNPDKYEDITNNSQEDGWNMMYPDGQDD